MPYYDCHACGNHFHAEITGAYVWCSCGQSLDAVSEAPEPPTAGPPASDDVDDPTRGGLERPEPSERSAKRFVAG